MYKPTPEYARRFQFEKLAKTPSDINEHLFTLYLLACECDSILELGMRTALSTTAFVMAEPKKVISIDQKLVHQSVGHIQQISKELNVHYEAIESESLKMEIIDHFDMIFFDTYHSQQQLESELFLYGPMAKKYIVIHDTILNGMMGEDNTMGILPAIRNFMKENKQHWELAIHYTNNNGLAVYKRKHLIT